MQEDERCAPHGGWRGRGGGEGDEEEEGQSAGIFNGS